MFNYEEALKRLKLGKKVTRKEWTDGVRTLDILAISKNYVQVFIWTEGCKIQVLDGFRWAFWDVQQEDKEANDWYEKGENNAIG